MDVKLADGTTSANDVGTVQMRIAETVTCNKPILVTFFVMKGNSNLLDDILSKGCGRRNIVVWIAL